MTACSGVQFQLGLKRRRVQCTALGRRPKKPSKGLRPHNRHSQKRKSETVLVSGVLPVLVGPVGVSFPGSCLWFFFPVPACFCLFFFSPSVSFHWPRASRSSFRMGGTSGQTHGHRPKNRWRRRPKNRLLQVFLCVRLCCVPRRACLVLCLPVCYSIFCVSQLESRWGSRSIPATHDWTFSRLRCPGVLFVLKLCKTAKCPSFVCYRFGCAFQVLVLHLKREHAVGRRSRISRDITSGAVSAFLVRQQIHEPIRQSTDFGKNTFFYVKMYLRSRGRHSSLRLLVLVRLRSTGSRFFSKK